MALRSEAYVALSVMAMAATAGAQPFEFTARQQRIWRDKPATVVVDDKGISAKREGESRHWAWDDVQQLTLSCGEMKVLTYADSGWQGGRDREWVFERVPEGTTEKLYPFLASRLEARLTAAIAVPPEHPQWEIPVKLLRGFGGPEGTLIRGAGTVVFRSPERNESRTWSIEHIEGVSSANPFDLAVTVAEHRGLLRSSPSEYRFQLKRPMSEARFQELWRQLHRSKGLRILQSYEGENK